MAKALTKSTKRAILRRRNNGQWTEARFSSFVTSALRSAFRRWAPKYDVLKRSFFDRRLNKKSGRIAAHYKCNSCSGCFPQKEVQVDHIKPIGKDLSWDEFIEKLFCEAENLQVLCKGCHKIKTKEERENTKSH